jgi:hypothetical protein
MASKLGRNKPCRCGSGKKYKKCCLLADQARESEELRARADMKPPTPVVSELAKALSLGPPKVPRSETERQCPHAKVAALSTEQIVERLGQHGIVVTLEQFRELARGQERAWSIGEEVWLSDLQTELDGDSREFVCLAGWALWQRWLTDGPSAVTRRDWLEGGHELMVKNNAAGACDLWLPLWEWMRPLLTPLMRRMDAADLLLGGDQFMLNWTQDLCQELRNASLRQPEYVAPGIRYCEQVIAQFTEEQRSVLDYFRCDMADLLVLAGERQKAQAILTEIIEARPDEAIGYVQLAEALTLRSDDPADRQRAVSLLEQALARPVVDAGDWDVEARLEGLRESSAKSPATTTS